MSLWTPGGEHKVPREEPSGGAGAGGGPSAGPASGAGAGPRLGPEDDPLAGLSPEERAEAEAMAAEMAEVRRQLADVPAAVVVANHVMGFYELAAIHLSQSPPNLAEARVAIDAMGAVVEGLAGRLGVNEPTLKDALGQIRLAFVQLTGSPDQTASPGPEPGSSPGPEPGSSPGPEPGSSPGPTG
jgi:hypothetical protein